MLSRRCTYVREAANQGAPDAKSNWAFFPAPRRGAMVGQRVEVMAGWPGKQKNLPLIMIYLKQ